MQMAVTTANVCFKFNDSKWGCVLVAGKYGVNAKPEGGIWWKGTGEGLN